MNNSKKGWYHEIKIIINSNYSPNPCQYCFFINNCLDRQYYYFWPVFFASINSITFGTNSIGDPITLPPAGWKRLRIDVISSGPIYADDYDVYRDGVFIGIATLDDSVPHWDEQMGRLTFTNYYHCIDDFVPRGHTYIYSVEEGNSVPIYVP